MSAPMRSTFRTCVLHCARASYFGVVAVTRSVGITGPRNKKQEGKGGRDCTRTTPRVMHARPLAQRTRGSCYSPPQKESYCPGRYHEARVCGSPVLSLGCILAWRRWEGRLAVISVSCCSCLSPALLSPPFGSSSAPPPTSCAHRRICRGCISTSGSRSARSLCHGIRGSGRCSLFAISGRPGGAPGDQGHC